MGELEGSALQGVLPSASRNEDGSITADARMSLEDICAMMQVDLKTEEEHEDIDTIGGFVFNLAGHMPSRGEVVRHEETGVEFEVVSVAPRRIKTLRIILS